MKPIPRPPAARFLPAGLLLLALLLLSACAPETETKSATLDISSADMAAPDPDGSEAPPNPAPVAVWIHAGTLEERNIIREYIHDFNTMQNEIQVDLVVAAPEESYDEEVQAAFERGADVDIIQLNAPHLYKYIQRNHLLPLDDLLADELQADLLPSVISQGSYGGKLYSVATSDVGIGLYLNPMKLYGMDVRLPRSVRTAWTAEEFDRLLALVYERSDGQPVLDLKMNYTDGWLAHIFAPVLTSAGAGLLNPETQRAEGFVNSEEAVRAMTLIQSWFERGFIDPNEDDAAFTSGRVTFSWTGHWDFLRYDRELNAGFAVLPVPDFGSGARTAHGGWSWSITRTARSPEAAATFLEFMLKPEHIVEMTELTGAAPARRAAVGRSSHYGEQLRLETLARQLEDAFATRPQTAAQPAIMSAFQSTIDEIIAGADVRTALDQLALRIDGEVTEAGGE